MKKFKKMECNFIVIEGNIGSGKTSLAKKIAKEFNAKLILEEFENNPFLKKFYKDPGKNSFPLELFFMAERFQQLSSNTIGSDLFSEKTISDYSFFKSLLFAQNNLNPDELKLFNEESKVIGISLKDRGAILPAGHAANAAYWMDSEGKWITSSFYMQSLPSYIEKINNNNPSYKYLQKTWESKGLFKHDLSSEYALKGNSAIKTTPFGNTILKDLALEI